MTISQCAGLVDSPRFTLTPSAINKSQLGVRARLRGSERFRRIQRFKFNNSTLYIEIS